MPVIQAFGVGILGALVVYLARFRTERLQHFLYDPKRNWAVLLWDLVIFLICGGLVVSFFVQPDNAKVAFIGGMAWEGLITNIPTKGKE